MTRYTHARTHSYTHIHPFHCSFFQFVAKQLTQRILKQSCKIIIDVCLNIILPLQLSSIEGMYLHTCIMRYCNKFIYLFKVDYVV